MQRKKNFVNRPQHLHLQNLELCLGECFSFFFADILNLFVAVRQLWHQFKAGKLILNEYYETSFKQHYNRGWCPKFAPGLNIKIGMVQKVYEWSNCPFAKKIPPLENHLAKGQFDHSYTFWTMPILIFSPGANFGHHPL